MNIKMPSNKNRKRKRSTSARPLLHSDSVSSSSLSSYNSSDTKSEPKTKRNKTTTRKRSKKQKDPGQKQKYKKEWKRQLPLSSSSQLSSESDSDTDSLKQNIPSSPKETSSNLPPVAVVENTAETNSPASKKHKDPGRKQKYKKEWQRELPWIEASPLGELYARCNVCGCDSQGSFTNIKRHGIRSSHMKKAKSVPCNRSDNIFEQAKNHQVLSNAVKAAEIKIGLFFAEHDIPLAVADHFIELLPTLDHESIILKKVNGKRTKCTSIIKNVVGKYSFDNTVAILKTTKFSLMIDESTDISVMHHLIVIVRFLINYEPKDVYLVLLELGSDAKHETLFKLLVDFFNENEIPFRTNMIAFASDGANVMMGRQHSVSALLRKEVPNVFVFKCLCHSLALCASYAYEKLPSAVEELVKQVYSYFKHSSSRHVKFKEIQQTFTEIKRHRLLKLSKTRWLAVKDCVVRILEQYPVLLAFFETEAKQSTEANSILVKLQNPVNSLYLGFLEYVLPLVTNRNQSFQAEKPKIAVLYREMESLYRTILRMYLSPVYVQNTDVSKIQYRHPDYFVKDEKLYVGPGAAADIETLNLRPAELKAFYTNCRNFLVELAVLVPFRFVFCFVPFRVLVPVPFRVCSPVRGCRHTFE